MTINKKVVQTMELNLNKTGTVSMPPMDDLTFALHALAVIKVHSEQEGEEQKLTLRKIAQGDSYLVSRENHLLFNMMCAFGQHAVPVFEKFLTAYGKPTDCSSIVAEIRGRLHV